MKQWFYFSTLNLHMPPKTAITFTIKNLYKKKSSFQDGMKPYVFSLKHYEELGIGWHRAGTEILYYKNKGDGSKSLQFTYEFLYTNDTVYFAHYVPYTYTRL